MTDGEWIRRWAGDAAPPPDRFVALGGMRLSAPPDPQQLRSTLDSVLSRHRVLGRGPVPLTLCGDVWAAAAARRYPPDAQCLLWAYLAGRELLLVAHHSVADPWSMRLLLRDVLDPHRAPAAAPPAPAAKDIGGHIAFWDKTFTEVPELAAGSPGTGERKESLGTTAAQVAAVAKRAHTTPFVVLLTAFARALRPPGELFVPVLTYGRTRADWERVGFFMNVLPVRLTGLAVADVHHAFAQAYLHEIAFPRLLRHVSAAQHTLAAGGPTLAQFEVIQVPGGDGVEPLDIPAGLGLGGPVLPVNGLACWLEPGERDEYTICVRHNRFTGDQAAALIGRFIDAWRDIDADPR